MDQTPSPICKNDVTVAIPLQGIIQCKRYKDITKAAYPKILPAAGENVDLGLALSTSYKVIECKKYKEVRSTHLTLYLQVHMLQQI